MRTHQQVPVQLVRGYLVVQLVVVPAARLALPAVHAAQHLQDCGPELGRARLIGQEARPAQVDKGLRAAGSDTGSLHGSGPAGALACTHVPWRQGVAPGPHACAAVVRGGADLRAALSIVGVCVAASLQAGATVGFAEVWKHGCRQESVKQPTGC